MIGLEVFIIMIATRIILPVGLLIVLGEALRRRKACIRRAR